MTVFVEMRGNESEMKWCVPNRGENFKMYKNLFQSVATCHDEIVKCIRMTLVVTHFVDSS